MKKQVSKPLFFAILAIVAVAIGWYGWNSMETPENRGLDEEAIFRAAEKKAKEHGIDIRTVPKWSELYYKYHPGEKPPSPTQAASDTPPVMPGMPASGTQSPSQPAAPGTR